MINETSIAILDSVDELFIASWDKEKGYEIVSNNNTALKELQIASKVESYFARLQEYICEDDLPVYQVLIRKLIGGISSKDDSETIKDSKISVTVRLLNDGDGIYHKIDCFFKKNEKQEIVGVLTTVFPLDSEEVYREVLAHTVTNDRSNAVFAVAAKQLLQKYPDRNFAIIQFDIAKFKAVNSVYGEQFGDELLQFIVDSLKVMCDDHQLYVRLSADVFMILTSYESDEDIMTFIHKMNDNLTDYKDVKYRLVYGVSKVLDQTVPLRKYGDQAALARQNAKKDLLVSVGFYQDDMNKSVLDSKFVEDNVEDALYNNEFVMYLQPKYSIEQNKIVGAEALVRWFQKDRGMIPPDQFIPILEMNGLIREMDAFIWEEACKTLRRWLDQGLDNIPISVNVSRVHLNNSYFIDLLNSLLEEYQIPKHLLEIEITESAGEGEILEQINRLKEDGFILLMDDFGAGYSSLNTLKDTKFDVVKIDRGFLQDFIDSDRGQKIVQHTISMTKSIGLDLVAEGVETLEQAEFLSKCGCDTAQGYYYAKPMTVAEMEKLMGL